MRLDLIGTRFDKLVVLAPKGMNANRQFEWLCRCDCGNTTVATTSHLRSGHTRSCSCLAKNNATRKHGHSLYRNPSPTYEVWCGMKKRCLNPNDQAYPQYGGRGIKVCDRWLHSFENFLADMGERPANRSLDRTDNNGNYEPNNCRWATRQQQTANRRMSHMVEWKGQRVCLAEASRLSGINYWVLIRRFKAGNPLYAEAKCRKT